MYVAMFNVRLYKKWVINAREIITYFNIITVMVFTWYTLETSIGDKETITNISIGIVFAQLLLVICYHTHKHMNKRLSSRIKKTAFYVKIKEKLPFKKQKRANCKPHPAINDIHDLLDMFDRPANANDNIITHAKLMPNEPTKSVVELSNPYIRCTFSVTKIA